MKAAEDVAKKQTTVDETMGTVLRIQTGGESKRAEEALGNLRRAVAGYDPAVEDDARAHAEAGHVEDDAEANAGADAPADVEPLAQTEILQAGLEAGANKALEAAETQEEKRRADEEKQRADAAEAKNDELVQKLAKALARTRAAEDAAKSMGEELRELKAEHENELRKLKAEHKEELLQLVASKDTYKMRMSQIEQTLERMGTLEETRHALQQTLKTAEQVEQAELEKKDRVQRKAPPPSPTCVKAQGPQPKRKAKERGGLSEKQGENSSQLGPSELPEAQVTVNVEAAQRAKGSFKVVSRSSEEGVQTMATSSSSSPVPPSPASERFVL